MYKIRVLRISGVFRMKKMGLAEHWYDFICFGIVVLALFGALFFIRWREFINNKPETPTRTCNSTMYESLIVISKEDHDRRNYNRSTAYNDDSISLQPWKGCWRGLGPAWLLASRFFSFAVLCVVLALDFRDYGPSIFLYYTEWTFALVIIYFAVATTVSAQACLLYYSKKAPTENGLLQTTNMGQNLCTSDAVFRAKENGLQSHNARRPGILGYLMQVVYQTSAGAVVLTDIIFWCVIVPFLPNVHLQLNMLMGCMHTLNAVTLLIDTSINSLPFPWFRIAYFVVWSCCYVIFQWVIHACGFTWWPYPFLALSTPWAPLWYFCLAVIHIPCYGFYWLVESTKNFLLEKLFPQSFLEILV